MGRRLAPVRSTWPIPCSGRSGNPAAAEQSPQCLVLGSGAVHGEKFFHRGLCDLSARSGVRLVANNSAPRHRVCDQPPPIAIGATVDIGGVGRHLDLGGFRASRQLLVACGDREHRGSCVAIAHRLRKVPGLGSASHPLHRSRRIVHNRQVADRTLAAKSHLSEHPTTGWPARSGWSPGSVSGSRNPLESRLPQSKATGIL